MKTVGICGRSGSGKTTVGNIISKKYCGFINCDTVSREVMGKNSSAVNELVSFFGTGILNEEGELNRAKLASLAFGNEENIKVLNQITHKYILDAVEQKIKAFFESGEKIVFLDAPTLFESGLNKRCDFIISVVANEEDLLNRIKIRDNKTHAEAQKRLASQPSVEFLKAHSHYCIENNGTLKELEEKVFDVLTSIEEEI